MNKIMSFIQRKSNRSLPLSLSLSPWGDGYATPVDWRSKQYMEIYGDAEYSSVWVFACVKAIAQTVASVPFVFYKDTSSGRERLPQTHPLVKLFWGVNPRMTRYDFWEASMVYMELTGNCFWALEKNNSDGHPGEIWPLRPDRMRIIPNKEELVDGYLFSVGEKSVGYGRDEMIHLKYFNPLNELWGMSPLAAVRQGLLADFYAVMYNQKFFKQGARPSGVISTQAELNDAAMWRLRAEFDQAYSGAERSHRVILLEKGLQWQSISLGQKDMEFIEQRRLSREEILAVYKVPPIEVGILEHANYANSETQDRIFWTKGVIPRLRKIEECVNTFLAPRFGVGIFGEFDLSGVEALRDNELDKSDIATKLVGSDVWTVNEARKKLWNMSPVEWGDSQSRENDSK
ncbi:MAG: phage portal protein [Candidatus Brocadiales bacterium]|nr:phage portal protein [Candidatus Bathyanammoxibius amoris]